MTALHIRLKDLPAPIRAALERMGYHRPDVEVMESETYTPQSASACFTGNRGFLVVINVTTGESATDVGAFGGSNMFGVRRVDDDHNSYPIPPGCAVITGENGGRGAFARVRVAPGMLAPILPAGENETLPPALLLALSNIRGLKSHARAEAFERSRLGTYGVENPHVRALLDRKLISANKAGAIAVTTEGRNVSIPSGINSRGLLTDDGRVISAGTRV